MSVFEKFTNSQKVRAALHRDVRAISSETCHFLGLEVTKSAMEIIAELVYKKLSVYGTDLEAFCKHAKRTTINSEDVKLLARRNPSLLSHLNSVAPVNPSGQKRRKTVKPQETKAKADSEKTDSRAKEDANSKGKEDSTAKEDSRNKEKDSTEAVRKDDGLEEFVDDIILDDTIDLTFD